MSRAVVALWFGFFSVSVSAATLHVGSGGDGAFKTLAQALAQLAPGDTLLIADGIYRESIDLRLAPKLNQPSDSTRSTRIEAAPGARVVIKGSNVVTGWERLSGGLFVKRDWPINTQQIFVDGVSLQQIGGTVFGGFPERKNHPMAALHRSHGGIWPGRVKGGARDMTDNSFYYDIAEKNLYIKVPGDSLQGRVVEASVRPYLFFGEGVHNVNVSHLRFEHANTTDVSQAGAVSATGDRLVFDHIHISHVDGNGFDITGNHVVITDSTANYCGQVGMKVRGRNARLIGNETSYNNVRGFNKWWEAGGAKFVGAGGLQDSEIANHRAYFNRGDGIWFDWKNRNNYIHDSTAAYNTGMGIHYEASSGARIENNYVFGNKQRGIYLPKSSQSVIANNLVIGNGMEGVAVIDDGATKPEHMPKENRITANILGWNGKSAIVLPSQALDNVSNTNFFIDAQPPSLSMGWGTRDQPVLRGLAAWNRRTGQDQHSWQLQLPMPAQLAAELKTQTLQPDWTALRKRVAELPAIEHRSFRSTNAPGPKNL